MKWLRQQRKVESLSLAAKVNAGRMYRMRRRLQQHIHRSLQQPGSLAWAFAAGCLFGSARAQRMDKDIAAAGLHQQHTAAIVLQYLNSMAIVLNLLSATRTEQLQDQ
ncbi:MAG TPA: hypothetical protein VJN01_04935 [Xanthomonadales bacterium]|nr:hypothetical protein [Xanthomonadales bacterium]